MRSKIANFLFSYATASYFVEASIYNYEKLAESLSLGTSKRTFPRFFVERPISVIVLVFFAPIKTLLFLGPIKICYGADKLESKVQIDSRING